MLGATSNYSCDECHYALASGFSSFPPKALYEIAVWFVLPAKPKKQDLKIHPRQNEICLGWEKVWGSLRPHLRHLTCYPPWNKHRLNIGRAKRKTIVFQPSSSIHFQVRFASFRESSSIYMGQQLRGQRLHPLQLIRDRLWLANHEGVL